MSRFLIPIRAVLASLFFLASVPVSLANSVEISFQGTPHQKLFAVDVFEQQVIAVGGNGQLLRSEDGGATWQTELLVDSNAQSRVSAILGVSVSSQYALAVGQQGSIWRRADGQWHTVASPSTERWLAVDVVDHGLAVAVGGFGALAVSTDAGRNWVSVELDWEALLNEWYEPHLYDVVIDPSTLVITLVGEFGLVLQSSDRGATWQVKRTSDESLFSLSLDASGHGFAVGQDGVFIYTSDAGETWAGCDSSGAAGNLYGVAHSGPTVTVVGMRTALASHDACRSIQEFNSKLSLPSWLLGVRNLPGTEKFIAVGDTAKVVVFGGL